MISFLMLGIWRQEARSLPRRLIFPLWVALTIGAEVLKQHWKRPSLICALQALYKWSITITDAFFSSDGSPVSVLFLSWRNRSMEAYIRVSRTLWLPESWYRMPNDFVFIKFHNWSLDSSFIHSFIHLLIYSFIHSFIYSCSLLGDFWSICKRWLLIRHTYLYFAAQVFAYIWKYIDTCMHIYIQTNMQIYTCILI